MDANIKVVVVSDDLEKWNEIFRANCVPKFVSRLGDDTLILENDFIKMRITGGLETLRGQKANEVILDKKIGTKNEQLYLVPLLSAAGRIVRTKKAGK